MKKSIYIIGRDWDAVDIVNQKNIFRKFILKKNIDSKKNNVGNKYYVLENEIESYNNKDCALVVDDVFMRKKIIEKKKFNFVNIISKFSLISKNCLYNKGIFVFNNVFIGRNVQIGMCCKFNYNSQIHHNVTIGNNVVLAPNVTILSNVTIEDNVYIGANSILANDVKIGSNSIIGLGSKILKHVKKNSICYSKNLIVSKKNEQKLLVL
jgi:acetyltransferase-like isoleucine patch superfamily enzyme